MNPKEAFDDFLAKVSRNSKHNYGKRIELTEDTAAFTSSEKDLYRHLLREAKAAAKHLNDRSTTIRPFVPHFFITDSSHVNAFAKTHKGYDLVGLFRGSIIVPQKLFLRLYTHPDVDPHIGNAKGEIAPSPLTRLPTNIEQAGDLIMPKDSLRRKVAIYNELWGVVRMLIAHELAHIYLGHTIYAERHALGEPLMVNRKKW